LNPAAVRFLEVAPPAWAGLLAADPNATAAHRPELWDALAATAPGTRVWLAACFDGARLLGGAPLAIERIAGLTRLHALPWVLPGAPLAVPGAHAEVDAAIAEALARRALEDGVIGGEWSLYRPHGPAVARDALERLPGETTRLETAVLDLGGREAPPPADRKTRSDLRAARAAGLRFAEEPAALDPAYSLYVAQVRHWSGHRPLPIELSRRLLAGPAPVGRLFTVRDGRGLLSAALVLDHARETLVWWSGTHVEGRQRHAFSLLLSSIAEWAAAAGRERVNLGASPGLGAVAAFKRSLGARTLGYPVRWLHPAPAGWAARIVTAAQSLVRRGRHRGAPE